jgi:iron complex transport system substrate-binding protein
MHYNKKNLKNIVVLAALLILILLITAGCGGKEAEQSERNPVNNDVITVTDCVGRKVDIPENANRLACLCPEAGHAVAMLGKGDKIVAVVPGLKRDVLLTDMYPNIKQASVPRANGLINIEELVRSNPDLVFIKGETARNDGEVDKLKKAGIPYLVVDYNNMEEQQKAIEMIGQAIGAKERAHQYTNYYRECIERVTNKVKDIPESSRVRVYHSINEATRTDMKGTITADWTEAAGAYNVSVNADLKMLEGKYYASLEQILLWDADVFLINEPGVPEYIMSNKQWSPLQAVKNHRVYQMPNGISRWGHPDSLETPLVVLWTAQILYPDKFNDLDMTAEVKYFYREFFSYDVSDELAHDILTAKGMREAKS